ncbi:mRNA 3'-end-processing protein rna14 [Gaertneriomyces sp. JEL0708]|nr:mRNA 3'-end-processing protein rna14 [Gaertneriomyces sp. JEL0708]
MEAENVGEPDLEVLAARGYLSAQGDPPDHAQGRHGPGHEPLHGKSAELSHEQVAALLNANKKARTIAEAKSSKPDKLTKLWSKSTKNPWDVDVWAALLAEAQTRNDPVAIRQAFEAVTNQFPTSSRYWIAYVEFEQKQGNYEGMESIFAKSLMKVPSVDYWRFYLNYVRRKNSPPNVAPNQVHEARQVITQTFEFVLANVGYDKEAGYIWGDYVAFIKATETNSVYEEQQKMDSLRKAFHRAIWIPLANIEQLWKDYDAFENGLNKLTAKKLLSEKSAGYMTARTALREVKSLLEPIDKLQKTWAAKPASWTDKEMQILSTWKRYLAWERANPLSLDDKAVWIGRVKYAYQSALLMLRYFPEIWHDAADFLNDVGKHDEALAMLKAGAEIMPTSLLINLALAEAEEARRKDFAAVRTIYETLITNLERKLDEINQKYDAEREKLMSALSKSDDGEGQQDDWDGEKREREREKQKERQREVETKVEEKRKKETDEITDALAMAWVVYMRSTRRGQSIKDARGVFTKARKKPYATYHIYVAAALMEYYINKDSVVAGRVFEVGYKNFNPAEHPQAVNFILHYLDYLINLNDDNNTRALFERALSSLPSEKAKPVWARFLAYEIDYGELNNVLKVEKRRAEAYAKESKHMITSPSDIADRWRVLGIDNIGKYELGLAAQQQTEIQIPKAESILPAPALLQAQLNKVEERGQPRRFQSLESFHPERYPRPDLNKWVAYKPEPAAPQPASSETALVHDPNTLMVPEAVARFLSVLPAVTTYNGPTLPVNDIIELFRQIPLPPASNSKFVAWPPTAAQSASGARQAVDGNARHFGERSQAGMRERRDDRSGARGRTGAGQRGTRFDSSNQSRGVKRRGHDDDAGGGDGPVHINRPPEHDIFRARHQQKRMREDLGS